MSYFKRMAEHHQWKGGRVKSSHGYWKIRVGKEHPLSDRHGYAYEHRLVAQALLGRPLTKKDVVHHLNGNHGDNAPENLLVTSQADHARTHLTPDVARIRGISGNRTRWRKQNLILELKKAGKLA